MKKTIIVGIVGLVIGMIAGALLFPRVEKVTLAGSSPAGSVFARVAAFGSVINMATVGVNGTSTAFQNTDASDRFIKTIDYACEGMGTSNVINVGGGLASLTLQAATTSTANPALLGNTNFVLNTSMSTSTAGAVDYLSSSTPGLTGTVANRVWLAGSWLTFQTNATNTGICTVSGTYIPL